jgi:hypothetical protein
MVATYCNLESHSRYQIQKGNSVQRRDYKPLKNILEIELLDNLEDLHKG